MIDTLVWQKYSILDQAFYFQSETEGRRKHRGYYDCKQYSPRLDVVFLLGTILYFISISLIRGIKFFIF